MSKWSDIPRNVTLTIRLTEQEKEKLGELAKKQDKKISFLTYEIIKDFLEKN